jgi:hypothetical protein
MLWQLRRCSESIGENNTIWSSLKERVPLESHPEAVLCLAFLSHCWLSAPLNVNIQMNVFYSQGSWLHPGHWPGDMESNLTHDGVIQLASMEHSSGEPNLLHWLLETITVPQISNLGAWGWAWSWIDVKGREARRWSKEQKLEDLGSFVHHSVF